MIAIPMFTCSDNSPPKTSPNGNDVEKQEWNGIISGCELNCDWLGISNKRMITFPMFTCSGNPPHKTSQNGYEIEKQYWNGII